jgi:hypothetical protein
MSTDFMDRSLGMSGFYEVTVRTAMYLLLRRTLRVTIPGGQLHLKTNCANVRLDANSTAVILVKDLLKSSHLHRS